MRPDKRDPTVRPRRWPNQQEYEDSLLADALTDQELLQRQLICDEQDGTPKAISGYSGIVFKYAGEGQSLALKVFKISREDLRIRQVIISEFLETEAARQANCFVSSRYVDAAVEVGGLWYPGVVMHWSPGIQIDEFVAGATRQHDLSVVSRLPYAWIELLAKMRRLGAIHGDLQHGNVLVEPDGTLRLIDYDGMLVQSMRGDFGRLELGHDAYQHPLVEQTHGDVPLQESEDFAALVLLVDLLVVSQRVAGIEEHSEGGLPLTREDLWAPDASSLFALLRQLDGTLGMISRLLAVALADLSFSSKALEQSAELLSPPVMPSKKKIQAPTSSSPQYPENLSSPQNAVGGARLGSELKRNGDDIFVDSLPPDESLPIYTVTRDAAMRRLR